jgi:hypothetical protein
MSGRSGDKSLGRWNGGKPSDDLDGSGREELDALSLGREVLTTMVSGLVPFEDPPCGVPFSDVGTLRLD